MFVNYCKEFGTSQAGKLVSQTIVLVVYPLMSRLAYPSDLNDDECELIKQLIPVHQGVGHPQMVDL